MTTESNLRQTAPGVRTFRGRTLEELLPQIRAELGEDAVILREREGLVGGIGGFFAQRFIEVDARRGEGQSIDIYDDSPENDLRPGPDDSDADVTTTARQVFLPPEPVALGPAPPPVFEEPLQRGAGRTDQPTTRAQPRPFVPPTIQVQRPSVERSVPASRSFETGVFMERLREAASELPTDLEPAAAPAPVREPPRVATPPVTPPPVTPPSVATPPARVAPEPPAPKLETPSTSNRARQRPTSLRTNLPTGDELPPGFGTAPNGRPSHSFATATPFAPPLDISRRRESRLRSAISRMFGRRQPDFPRPAPPQPLDVIAAAQIANEMTSHGATHAWATQVISTVGAHGSPLAENLQAAATAELARRIVAAPPLPATGAAIAFIGSGGSGKTRCTAALATAYRRSSTLGVTVIALDNPDGARELHRLLGAEQVPVLSLTGEQAARAVAEARPGGLVLIDTPTATATDPAAVQALGRVLAPLGLDAMYVTLPATLGAPAARRALAGFGQLRPTAVAITHADETDQLAVAVEIAVLHRIPLAYLHAGTDHNTALSAVDPPGLARQLLS